MPPRLLNQTVAMRWGSTNTMMQSWFPHDRAFDAMSAIGRFLADKNLSSEQGGVVECYCHEPKGDSMLKRAMYRTYNHDSLPNASIAGIDHIPNDTFEHFNGIVLDDEAGASQTVYKDVLLAAIKDPPTKTLRLLSDEHMKRAKTGLCHMKGREEELRAVSTSSGT